MKIAIKSKEKNFNLWFPSSFIFNGAVATLGCRFINSYLKNHSRDVEINVAAKDARRLFKEIIKAKRNHKNWYIVEVDDADGESVKIKL